MSSKHASKAALDKRMRKPGRRRRSSSTSGSINDKTRVRRASRKASSNQPAAALPATPEGKAQHFLNIGTTTKGPKAREAVDELVKILLDSPSVYSALDLDETLEALLQTGGKAGIGVRRTALMVIKALTSALGAKFEVSALKLLSQIITIIDDKDKVCRTEAKEIFDLFFASMGLNAVNLFATVLLKPASQWQGNVVRLEQLNKLCTSARKQITRSLGDAIPKVAADIHDLKAEVSAAAKKTLLALCSCCDNVDVVPLIPVLANALENIQDVGECVFQLASTTFVQTVEMTTFSIINPILLRGLRGTDNTVKRACARIAENMAKLVEDPRDLHPFLPSLQPLVVAAAENVSDPEVRKVCAGCVSVLEMKSKMKAVTTMVEMDEVLPAVTTFFSGKADLSEAVLAHIAEVICVFNDQDANFSGAEDSAIAAALVESVAPLLATTEGNQEGLALKLAVSVARKAVAIEEEAKIDAEELCNCEFSLAFGNKVLLRKTRLRLHKGFKYGLIGKNDCGKTSLMQAIADHRVDGFPDESELRTIFVQTDVQGELSDLTCLEYVCQDEHLIAEKVTKEAIEKALQDVGFCDGSPANTTTVVGALSGGWRMKLALARATLLNADILLMDEPTNHLDTYNKAWLEEFLLSRENVTCVMVSHDSGFLDRVCGNMMTIEDFGLSTYQGNLSAYVKSHPKAKAFFELKSDTVKFNFPQPGFLQGITSKGKAILSMHNITFTYPGAPKPQLNNVSVQVSLGSRVACVGVNGAGKSTMIKLLTGELEPDAGSGKVWSHPNCRVGYIAQHAFHHIENRLGETANEYICGRYRNGNDREAMDKVTNLVSPEELEIMKKPMAVKVTDPETDITRIVNFKIVRLTEGRRENRKEKVQEYECALDDYGNSVWISRKILMKGGWEKVLVRTDQRIAQRAASFDRPLTKENVQTHLANVGLEAEFSTHTRMKALSGGQKVKVVLAAALWNCPHILILDEPTNYLDRESLGALAEAIRAFEGGVVMITHHSQFCDDLCPTVWHLENNTLNVKGDAEWMAEMKNEEVKTAAKPKAGDIVKDKFGNDVEYVLTRENMTPKQIKALARKRDKENRRRKKAGEELLDSDEDEW